MNILRICKGGNNKYFLLDLEIIISGTRYLSTYLHISKIKDLMWY